MNKTKLPKSILMSLAAPVALALLIPSTRLVAQRRLQTLGSTETKMQLMTDALQARDQGDLAKAKENLEELLQLAPDDATVQKLLDEVNAQISSQPMAEVTIEAPAQSAASTEGVSKSDSAKPETKGNFLSKLLKSNSKSENSPTEESVAATAAPADPATLLKQQEEARIQDLLTKVKDVQSQAKTQANADQYDQAIATINEAIGMLPLNTLTEKANATLSAQRDQLLLDKSNYQLKKGDIEGARASLAQYSESANANLKKSTKQAEKIDEAELSPPTQPIAEIEPEYHANQVKLAQEINKGRSQYAAGDVESAQETFKQVLVSSPDNPEAKYYLRLIADSKASVGALNREKTRAQMLEDVTRQWERPGVYRGKAKGPNTDTDVSPLNDKLNAIKIPGVSFSNTDLSSVISTLTAISADYDQSKSDNKGVNIVLIDRSGNSPKVTINLVSEMSLKRVLDLIVQTVGYQYEVQNDVVIVSVDTENYNLDTVSFPISNATVQRMTGVGRSAAPTTGAANGAVDDPFAAPAPTATTDTGGIGGGESDMIRSFLQKAGVNFDGVEGSSLVYDGAAILVTQNARNIEKIRNILNRYNDIKQVEIEAKFMEVQEGALDELGVNWTASGNGKPLYDTTTGFPILNSYGEQAKDPTQVFQSANNSLAGAFTNSSSGGNILIDGQVVASVAPPSVPGGVDLGGSANIFGQITGVLGDFDVTAVIRALSQKKGSDLLSAPKVTVLSGQRASMTVAQELRYPNQYGEIQSEVGQGGGTNTGSAGVTITAGTPQDFTTRNIGVELAVTPVVEEDDYSISLDLNPRVTEFEGFVEYGGQSVAVTAGQTVTIPSGFYQPIFATREINTKVTVWDGATLIMGGLTREEVKRVDDKVPVLGDIPVLGRAFRSKGESSSKRNLLIFVTANLVSPGGSLKRQNLSGVKANSQFQSPAVITPSGSELRILSE